MKGNIWDMISPEQWTAIVSAIVLLIIALILFGRWLFFDHIPKLLDDKLQADKQGREEEAKEAEAKRKIELLEIQNQLDQTQSSREMLRLQNSEQVETRNALMKVIESMRADSQKRDDTHSKYLGEITDVFRGIQSNTAATLELLKEHRESDEVMAIGQSKVINQNETTHQKLTELSSDLAEVSQKLESIAVVVGRLGDRKTLDEIKEKVDSAIDRIKHIEEVVVPATIFDTPTKPMPAIVVNTASEAIVTVTEIEKEYSAKSDESEKNDNQL